MTNKNAAAVADEVTDNEQRLLKLQKLTETHGDPFHITRFDRTTDAARIRQAFEALAPGDKTDKEVSIAGRIMAIRNNGMFIDLLDETARMQVFHDLKTISEERKAQLKLLDLGDIVGVHGTVRRTPRGELTVDAGALTLLAKALEQPPEKYHGLKDVEARFRHREQDLVANEKTRTTLRARYRIVSAMREFLNQKGFLEVETPVLQVIAGGALARPFVTHHNALDIPLYLRIATELHLKRLVIGGISDKVYEIGRCFRNEGLSPKHNPEFTTLELYQAYVDYETMIEITEAIVAHLCTLLHGTTKVTFAEKEIDFTPPWPRKGMAELIMEKTGLDLLAVRDAGAAHAAAAKAGIKLEPGLSWGQIVEAVFGEKVEETLFQPIHVIDLPKDISPLAKAHPERPWLAQRFETYVNTWEIANAFSELNDPREQRARFLEQAEQKRKPDDPPHPIDDDFIKALSLGMPPMGGLGIGIDRLAMLLTDSQSIREVIAFPTMRPID
ncbi:MAG: lysine--tRNA ligase [Alphaproteobacteria bacterium]|nr:lysine--tRNA ligase [Alphaproteobacteria bacterium]